MMPEIDEKLIKTIVSRVVTQLEHSGGPTAQSNVSGVFQDVGEAVSQALEAQKTWADTSLEQKGKVIEALRQSMHENAEEFARRAQLETGLGRVEHKILKHHNAANATPGLEDLPSRSWSGDKGLTVEDYAPYGVIAAITPSTHPIPVLLNSIIIMIAAGNAAVFSVHPAAKNVSAYAMRIFQQVMVSAGGPPNLVCMIQEPTMEAVNRLFRHPEISLIAATGGPALVKAAFESGKKVIAAGPGNPPVLVDETADLETAASEIVKGAAFDNNILCIAEKETFVVDALFEPFMEAMEKAGAVRLNSLQIESLTEKAFAKDERGHQILKRDLVGKNASVLAKAAGRLTISDEVPLLFGETAWDHPFVQEEQMMPFMPVVRVGCVQEGIRRAKQAEHAYGHTAMIHSNNLKSISEFSRVLDTSIVVVNGSSLAGNGLPAGEGYFSHTIASPTGEGVCTPRDFARVRRICIYESLRIV